jgi:RNA polymerase sigma-70 factor, ECF subfamily
MPDTTYSNDDVARFVRLLLANERRIFLYILALLPNVADAEDVLQETSIVLWQKFAQYQPGTNFAAWACRVAYNTVRTYRAKRHRCRVRFDNQLFATVAADVEAMQEELDLSQTAVGECVEQLPPNDRDLLQRRYQPGATIKSLAAAVGRPVEGMYKAMRRIHDNLYDCIQRKLTSEGIHVRKP